MSIENSLVRRQVFNLRFINFISRKYQKEIEALYARISQRIAETPNLERLSFIRRDIERMIELGMGEIIPDLNQDIIDFALNESEFVGEMFSANSKVPFRIADIETIERALSQSVLDVSLGAPSEITMKEALEQFAEARAKDITLAINDGILLGETTPEIAKRISGIATARPKNQVDALVRTLINHTSSQIRRTTVAEHANLFEGEEWVAVLDSRTTLICSGRDGMVYPVGKGPYPPAHWNCRSVRVPVLRPEFRASSQSARRKTETGETVTGKKTFDSWLRDQSAEFQDEYFSQFPDGKEKAKLFRLGKLPLQQFRDETGRVYTLEELRNLNPIAFGDAGITI